jgi:hypothetical protein
MNILKSIGDRLFGKLVPSVKAGACRPVVGDRCCKSWGTYDCHAACR